MSKKVVGVRIEEQLADEVDDLVVRYNRLFRGTLSRSSFIVGAVKREIATLREEIQARERAEAERAGRPRDGPSSE